jgi:uncharacterized protein (DUF1015 family)
MATVKPFKAIRPTQDKAPFVISRSYQSYSKKELNANLEFNPFSFLHIINPGYKFDKQVSGSKRFSMVRNRYLEFLEDDILKKDTDSSFYLYKTEQDDLVCCGLFCATSVADYENNLIKKHEDTIKRRETMFAGYLKTVKFNAEPVLMSYTDTAEIKALLDTEKEKTPTHHFTTTDRVTHTLWVISDKKITESIQHQFTTVNKLYIADGHHRSASSHLLSNMFPSTDAQKEKSTDYFMSYLIPESQIRIYEFNRMIKDLNGLSKEEFLIRLDAYFRIENQGNMLYKPTKKHHFCMYLDGEFYSLYLRKTAYTFTDTLSALDTQILYKTVLEPILGISDLRNDKRIAYGYGKHNGIRMKNDIDAGRYTVGFNMLPIGISELKQIADDGLVMPPKSTYIEPKLRSGIAIYEL